MKIYRVYWWVKGAPEDRPGGPWWYNDFNTTKQRLDFIEPFRASLHKMVFYEGEPILHDPMQIYPPCKSCD